MDNSSFISLIAIVISIIALYMNQKNYNKSQLWQEILADKREIELHEQQKHSKNTDRTSIIPYFTLSCEKKIYVKEISDEEMLILPLSLINLGRESATNIRLEPVVPGGGLEHYFMTENSSKDIHFVYEYLDKQYALPEGAVNFSSCCARHNNAHNVSFKVRFNDLVGRTYEQDFRFQYSFGLMDKISMNHWSGVPVCIDDKDLTNNN